ncbi:MAG: hypothetical protein WEB67_01845 [Acidimicrobiia bacterium]
MRRLIPVLALSLVLAACGDDSGGETTSTQPAETSTSSTDTSTTMAETTTTVPETTTTEATTTTTELAGDWADEPLVVSKFGALGWWDGGNWVQVDELTSLPVSGGEDYQVVLFGSDEVVSGGTPTIQCEPVFNPGVELSDADALGDWPDPVGVAISAPWDLTPHFVQEEIDDGTYSDLARPLLAARGLDVENPVIKQVIRFDLDGNGENEVVAVAEDIEDSDSLFAQEGDYSLVFLRIVVEGEVQTGILGESIVDELQEGVTPFVLSHSVAAVADLSGDGKMEMIIHEVYYEGSGWSVWEYVNDDLGPVFQIGSGCGV